MKLRNFAVLVIILLLVPVAFADLFKKFDAKPIANGVIRLTFTLYNDSEMKNFRLLRDSSSLKEGSITADPFSEIHDDLETRNGETYQYTLKVFNNENNLIKEKTLSATADSQYPKILSERKILSKSNILMIKTDENSFCKAGLSLTDLHGMDGKEKLHTIRLGLVNGLNIIYVLCEDDFGNLMINPKMIEYIYDSIGPGQLKNTEVLNYIPSRVSVSWDAGQDANEIKEYRIYKKSPNEDFKLIAVSNKTSYVDSTNLRYGKTYYYAVSAVDNADNEGRLSEEKNITIYNTNVFLDILKSYSTKTGNLTIHGRASSNLQVIATFDSSIYETMANESGDFSFSISTEKSRMMQVEAFDEDGNSKIETVSITKLAPDIEVQKTVAVREQKTDYIYIFLIAFLFIAVIFIIVYSTRQKNLYSDIDHYIKKRRTEEKNHSKKEQNP